MPGFWPIPAPAYASARCSAALEAGETRSPCARRCSIPQRRRGNSARYHLRETLSREAAAALYRGAIAAPGSSAYRAAAVAGLSETGTAADLPALRELADKDTPRVSRAALRALLKLDAAAAREILLTALGDARRGLRREALRLLGPRLAEPDAATLRAHWANRAGRDAHILTVAMTRLPPWTGLLSLLEIAPDAPEPVNRALALWRPWERRGLQTCRARR